MSESAEPSKISVGGVTWLFPDRAEPLRDPYPVKHLPGVVYKKIPLKGGNGIQALHASLIAAQSAKGKRRFPVERTLKAAEKGEVEQAFLREEQLVRILKKLGDYRLAIIEPRQSRTRLAYNTKEDDEGELIYIITNGCGHWDGVQISGRGRSLSRRGFYPQYTLVQGYPTPSGTTSVEEGSDTDHHIRHQNSYAQLKDEIRIEMYEADRRNGVGAATTRGVRTWAGESSGPGEVKMGEGQRSVSRRTRPGKRKEIARPRGRRQAELLRPRRQKHKVGRGESASGRPT